MNYCDCGEPIKDDEQLCLEYYLYSKQRFTSIIDCENTVTTKPDICEEKTPDEILNDLIDTVKSIEMKPDILMLNSQHKELYKNRLYLDSNGEYRIKNTSNLIVRFVDYIKYNKTYLYKPENINEKNYLIELQEE